MPGPRMSMPVSARMRLASVTTLAHRSGLMTFSVGLILRLPPGTVLAPDLDLLVPRARWRGWQSLQR